jgi:hypothetical protein
MKKPAGNAPAGFLFVGMNTQSQLTEDRKFALRAVIEMGLSTVSICCQLEALRFYNFHSWFKYYRLAKTIGVFTRWLQKLAFFSSIEFEGFDEIAFWQEYQLLCKKFPNNPFVMTKQFYDQALQRITGGK